MKSSHKYCISYFINVAIFTVLHPVSSDCYVKSSCSLCNPVFTMLHFHFIVSKILLFPSMSFIRDLVIRMFHCLFIVLKISLFAMSSRHDTVIRMFHCLFIVLKISVFAISSRHDPVIRMFLCLLVVLKI